MVGRFINELVHRHVPSPNFDDRDQPISMVVLHYTGMPTAEEALERLIDPQAKVSAHYLVTEDGEVIQLVDENKRAWHAGLSYWRGKTGINNCSIGIELVNPGHEWGYRPFPREQMAALMPLLSSIVLRHDIAPDMVVGHSDIAPARKQDPGEMFDWKTLARHQIAAATPSIELGDPFWNDGAFYLALERYGYDVSDGRAATIAFARRFRPGKIDGEIDGELRAILFALLIDRDEALAEGLDD